MDLALILVHYHTPELAVEAVGALRRSLAETAGHLSSEILVVDNGSDEAGRASLASLPVRLIEPGRNLGYAGGVNRGVGETEARRLAILNPDVLVRPDCLHRLLEELDAGAAVAGPRFYLDRGRRFLIPPTERRTRRWELLAALADRGEPWTRRARRAWRRHARRHWCSGRPLSSTSLSGALLVFTRRTWERAGPWDEALPLYFEEDDWLKRVRRCGLETRYVPAAEAIHLHGRSAVVEPRAVGWFAESRRRFRRRWYGPVFTRLLEALEPGPELRLPWPATRPAGRPALLLDTARRPEEPLWLELSPSPRGFPAAAHRLGDEEPEWQMPADLWQQLQPGSYRLQLVTDRGRELECWTVVAATEEEAG